MNIKVLTEKNVKEFWDLRMIALKEKNVAFGSSYEEEIKVSNDIHISRYKNDFI
ncbi:MAG: hypothetical protein K0Q49_1255, partial [Haloplasmataceae bacterium]|nr:hypothetical protein [Haloplasmataceae bacterium]